MASSSVEVFGDHAALVGTQEVGSFDDLVACVRDVIACEPVVHSFE